METVNLSELRVGVVGFGNMASAMVKGWLASAALLPGQIHVSAAHYEPLVARAKALGVHPWRTSREVVAASDWIVLAVKPHLFERVIAELGSSLVGKRVVSVAVGMHFAELKAMLPERARHVSVMPNTPVAVGEGVILTEATPTEMQGDSGAFTEADWTVFQALMAPLGRVVIVPPEKMAAAGIISGCGPAWAAMVIEALGDAAVKHGIARAQAYELASQMLMGTAALQLATREHPGVMKDAVTSPGGTTIVGVAALERAGLRSAMIEAVDAVVERIRRA